MLRRPTALAGLSLVAALAACPAPAGPPPAAPAAPATSAAAPPDPAPPPPPTLSAEAVTLAPPIWPAPRVDGGVCAPSEENLARVTREILMRADDRAATPSHAWDKKRPPAHLERVARRFALTSEERALLTKNGFVALPAAQTRGYARAYHEIYQSQLPLYVTVDSILHAMYKSHEHLVKEAERGLATRLSRALSLMIAAYPAFARELPKEVAEDVDLYLAVARALATGEAPQPSRADRAEVAALAERATQAKGGLTTLDLFGRSRVVDFSQYAPRGHYAGDEELERYFRASMWLSRLELNLVSRASRSSQPGATPNPEETPREAVDAMALAELATRSGAQGDWDALDRAWTELAGKREDVSPRALVELTAKAKIGSLSASTAAPALKAAIGSGYGRTTRVHYMPQGSTPLPVIFTMLGPRITADGTATSHLVHADVAGRELPGIADVATMLGHDHARRYLSRDLAAYPALAARLEDGRRTLAAGEETSMGGAWLSALRTLAEAPPKSAPSFMHTHAFSEMRMSSIAAGYAQLRHEMVLVAGQPYTEGGCEVPDGFVEPAPSAFRALRALARVGARAMGAFGSADGAAHYARVDGVLAVLEQIATDEVRGRALTEAQKSFLSMVVEIVPASSDSPGRYDGWYFSLFPGLDAAFEDHALLADWFTGSDSATVVYAGARDPRFALFVVDVGGEPRVMVGPVARGFQAHGSTRKRYTDADAETLAAIEEPWAAAYTASAPPPLPLTIARGYVGDPGAPVWGLTSTRALGHVTVELLDHHRERLAARTVTVGAQMTAVRFSDKENERAELVRVVAGRARHELSVWGPTIAAFGGMETPPWEAEGKILERVEKAATAAPRPALPAPRGTSAPPPPVGASGL